LEWLLNRKLKGRGGFAMMARVSFVGSPMAEPIAFKYRAFISYGHADTDWAKWLHRGLEGRTDTETAAMYAGRDDLNDASSQANSRAFAFRL
jgi:hypothetical protein